MLNDQEQTIVLEAREILGRYLNCNPVLSSWQALLDYCALSVRGEIEAFHVLYLDRKNRIISDECMGLGTVDHVPVYPREHYDPDVYPRYNPGPNAVRECSAHYVQEARPSGTVITPRMNCFWRRG